jgi:hypothetical protein
MAWSVVRVRGVDVDVEACEGGAVRRERECCWRERVSREGGMS